MHMLRDTVMADRYAGFPSGSIVNHVRLNNTYALVTANDFDVVLEQRGVSNDAYHWATVCHCFRHADIVVSFFDLQLAAPSRLGQVEFLLRMMRCLGIRLIFEPNGLDVVHENGIITRYDMLASIRVDYPRWDLEADTPSIIERIRMYCRNADFVVSGDSVTERFLPRADLRFKYFPIDCTSLVPSFTTDNDVPVIAHAPNHRNIKGTKYLLEAVESLRRRGIPIELQLIEKVPPAEARALFASADIIADQFCLGAFGMFALEGMALGKPVLAYLDQEHLGDPAFNLPIINSTAENLEDVLAVMVQLPQLRQRIGRASREEIEHYQSIPALGEVWGHIYRHLWWRQLLDLSRTAHFSPKRKSRSFSENPLDEEFWPVDVTDIMSEIKHCLEHRTCAA